VGKLEVEQKWTMIEVGQEKLPAATTKHFGAAALGYVSVHATPLG
jgi:hypothetical protein